MRSQVLAVASISSQKHIVGLVWKPSGGTLVVPVQNSKMSSSVTYSSCDFSTPKLKSLTVALISFSTQYYIYIITYMFHHEVIPSHFSIKSTNII